MKQAQNPFFLLFLIVYIFVFEPGGFGIATGQAGAIINSGSGTDPPLILAPVPTFCQLRLRFRQKRSETVGSGSDSGHETLLSTFLCLSFLF